MRKVWVPTYVGMTEMIVSRYRSRGLPLFPFPIIHPAFEDEKHFLVDLMVMASALGEIIVHFKELHSRLGHAEHLGDGTNLLL
jgi:hypothetical protein